MNAQQRTLEDLKSGINVQIDKSGRIRHLQQPQMGLPSVEIIDKEIRVRIVHYLPEGKGFTLACGYDTGMLLRQLNNHWTKELHEVTCPCCKEALRKEEENE
ncbi:hypothetical protein KA005_28730 [bacterium]|nr:hypothetical protein [bacterium]